MEFKVGVNWMRIDVFRYEHPKFIEARALAMQQFGDLGPYAVIGFADEAMSHCNRYFTDGFVQRSYALLRPHGMEMAEILVKAGIWLEDATCDGWRIHDYDKYQKTKAQVEQERAAKSAAGKRGGKQSASKRQAGAKQPSSTAVAEGKPDTDTDTEFTPLRGVNGGARLSAKEIRTRQRLGLGLVEGPGGDAA